jgi:hypothetical protein
MEGHEDEAFREPDDVESRLIAVATSQQTSSSHWIAEVPVEAYQDIKYADLDTEKTFRWNRTDGTDQPLTTRRQREQEGVIASTFATGPHGELRWMDALPAAAGVERDSSALLLLRTTMMTAPMAQGRGRGARRTIYAVEAVLALRQEVDTTVSMPRCRAWDGVFLEESLAAGNTELVSEVVQRSLVSGGSYRPPAQAEQQERSYDIWSSLLNGDDFLNALD